ncbi:MAG: BTAD domain-containing putative transcriptional regulator [Gaiella sp.]
MAAEGRSATDVPPLAVLGPLLVGGAAPELPRQAQILLAALLLRANEPLSPQRLSDDIWGNTPPASAANALQVYVSRIRKTLAEAHLQATISRGEAGYAIDVDPDHVDMSVFAGLVESAALEDDPSRAAETLHAGLALWRGPALDGLTFEGSAALDVRTLEESRLAALERRIELDLMLGRHAELVVELPALVAAHPFREPLHRDLILALYRSGRQADALDHCREARRIMVDELGIEPGDELRELERAVLQQDPALQLSRSARQRLLADAGRAPDRRPAVVIWIGLDDEPLAEEDPERVETMLDRWSAALSTTLRRHGVTPLPRRGPDLIGLAGVPEAREDDSLRACRAALDVRATHTEPGDGPLTQTGLRIGLEAGDLVISVERLDDAAGPLVSSARRLAATAEPGEILLGERIRGLLGDGVVTAGADGLRLVQVERTAEAIPRVLARPLVGRADELVLLRELVRPALDNGAPRLVLVSGPAGIGKSRLVTELTASDDTIRTLRARCLPDEEDQAFAPLRDVLRELEGGDGGLARLVGAGAAETLLALTGATTVSGSREDTFLAIRRALEALAEKQPLLFVAEDLHWAEPTFVDLLRDIARSARGRLAFVATARPEFVSGRETELPWRLALEPLSTDVGLELVGAIPRGSALPADVQARIVVASGGNPLFIEQLVAMADETTDGDPQVPGTLRGLLSARVDRLEAADRATLEIASVLGEWFEAGQIEAVAGDEDELDVPASLHRLHEHEVILVSPRNAALNTIAHPLLRSTTYDRIAKRRRADLHERYAALEAGPDGAGGLDETVGYHLERAFRFRVDIGLEDETVATLGERASGRLVAAGRRSVRRGDVTTAVSMFRRAAGAVLPGEHADAGLLLQYGDALRESGHLAEAEATLTQALSLVPVESDERLHWRIHASLVRVQLQLHGDDVDTVHRAADEALTELTRLEDAEGLSVAWWSHAWIAWLGCRAADTEEALEHAMRFARAAGDERAEAHGANLYLGAGLFGPLSVEQAVTRALELRERHKGRHRLLASTSRALAVLRAMQGRFDEARELVEDDREILSELGMRFLAAAATEAAGRVELLAGEPAAAEAALRIGYDELLEMGDRSALPTVAAMLAEALVELERWQEALDVVGEAARRADPGDLQAQVQWRLASAKTYAALGRRKRAIQHALEATEMATGTDFLDMQGDAWHTLAEVERRIGRAGGAREAIGKAIDAYARKGNVVAAARSEVLQRSLGTEQPPATHRRRRAADG